MENEIVIHNEDQPKFDIESKILVIRGQHVMIDRDLAELYGVETRSLNQAVKRNIERFPEEFCFQLNKEEFANWRSQIVISNFDKMGIRRAPYAFTEQGVAMLSAVLKSDRAIAASILIMKAFVALRHFLQNNYKIFAEIDSIKKHQLEHDIHLIESDKKIDEIFDKMDRYKIEDKQDTEVKVVSQTDMMGQMRMAMSQSDMPTTIRTKNILFIVSGAFDKLGDIIRKRLGKSVIGFGHQQSEAIGRTDAEILSEVQTHDLVEYGFEPEFIGRLPVRVALSDLCQKDLEKILTGVSNNYIQQYQEAFEGYDIQLNVSEDAIKEIAHQAAEEKTGARGLLTVLERTFRDFKYMLPGLGVKTLDIVAEDIQDPKKGLGKVIQKYFIELRKKELDDCGSHLVEEVKTYCEEFRKEYGFTLDVPMFTIYDAFTIATEAKEEPIDYVKKALANLPHALHLIHHPQDTPFTVTQEFIKAPEEHIDKMVKEGLQS